MPAPTALIADDEPLLREILRARLAKAWPALQIVAEARNGREAIEQFERLRPGICFLDVHMPGVSGVEAARAIGRRAHLVFVTAFDQYALEAFEHGALDYLVKPVTPTRLDDTVARLQARLDGPVQHDDALLLRLAAQLAQRLGQPTGGGGAERLRWVRAQVGDALLMIPVETIDYLKADSKYTLVAYRDEQGRPAEAVIRLALKELVAQLDPALFAQVHRSVVVNLQSVRKVRRGDNDTAQLELRTRVESLPVSRSYLHLFREM